MSSFIDSSVASRSTPPSRSGSHLRERVVERLVLDADDLQLRPLARIGGGLEQLLDLGGRRPAEEEEVAAASRGHRAARRGGARAGGRSCRAPPRPSAPTAPSPSSAARSTWSARSRAASPPARAARARAPRRAARAPRSSDPGPRRAHRVLQQVELLQRQRRCAATAAALRRALQHLRPARLAREALGAEADEA